MEEKLNLQMNAEFYSANLYLAMAAWFKSVDLSGFANWMEVQYEEEIFHARKFFDFIDLMDGRIQLSALAEPPLEWASPVDAFEETFKHEQKVTQGIHELTTLAEQEQDHATRNFLQWFVNEQVEEESTAKSWLKKLRFVGDSKSALLMIDKEMSARVFTPPTKASAE
jgi:ferritin